MSPRAHLLVDPLVCRFIIISLKGGKLHFYATIGALVFSFVRSHRFTHLRFVVDYLKVLLDTHNITANTILSKPVMDIANLNTLQVKKRG